MRAKNLLHHLSSLQAICVLFFLATATLCLTACSATRPVDAESPVRNANAPAYPLTLTETDVRRERALAAWRRLTVKGNGATTLAASHTTPPDPTLAPVTATITALPAATSSLPLPNVGEIPVDDRRTGIERTREALRRFIVNGADLLGTTPAQLSLKEITEQSATSRVARYEQSPFLHPLRNNYGALRIIFTPGLNVVGLSSTALPVDDDLRRAVNDLTPRTSAEEVAEKLINRSFVINDAAGQTQSVSVAPNTAIVVRQLVIYPVLRKGNDPATLDLHLAWEVGVGDASTAAQTIYLDALTDDILNGASAS